MVSIIILITSLNFCYNLLFVVCCMMKLDVFRSLFKCDNMFKWSKGISKNFVVSVWFKRFVFEC